MGNGALEFISDLQSLPRGRGDGAEGVIAVYLSCKCNSLSLFSKTANLLACDASFIVQKMVQICMPLLFRIPFRAFAVKFSSLLGL